MNDESGSGNHPVTIAQFLSFAEKNTAHAITTDVPSIEAIREVDALFIKATDSIQHAMPVPPGFFLFRAHAAYLAAVRLATGGQANEAYPLLRLAIENAYYGYLVARKERTNLTWLTREESKANAKAVRDEFVIGKIGAILKAERPELEARLHQLYEETISSGAHPNPRGHLTHLEYSENEDEIQIKSLYLVGDGPVMRMALRMCSVVGITVLEVFSLIYERSFQPGLLTDKINDTRKSMSKRFSKGE